MIVDVHAHVFADPRIRPRPDATPFMSAEQQIAVMDRLGVNVAVILPLNSAECPAEPQSVGEVLHICGKYPGRFVPFCHIDPRLPRHPNKIRTSEFEFFLAQYKEQGCRGIGEMTARVPWDFHPMLCLLEAAAALGMPVTFHTITADVNSYGVIDEIGLPRLESVLKRYPDLILFGHSQAFWSEISADVTPDTKNGYPATPVVAGGVLPRLLREYPGLHGDLSAGSGLNALRRDPDHAWAFIDEFQDRLMLGLDFCSPRNDMPHIRWLTDARDAGHIAPEAFEKVMWKNANRLLHLGLDRA